MKAADLLARKKLEDVNLRQPAVGALFIFNKKDTKELNPANPNVATAGLQQIDEEEGQDNIEEEEQSHQVLKRLTPSDEPKIID